MKPSIGLSISLGLTLALTTLGCGGKSSKKTSTPPPAPQLTVKPDDKPVVTPSDPGPVNQPSVPVVTTPGNGGATPTNNGTGTTPVVNRPGNGTGSGTTTTPVAVISTLRGVWGVSLTQKPRTCSTIYDIRAEKSLAIHILCPNETGKSVAVQTDNFTLVSDDGANAVYQSGSSTCAIQSRTLRFNYKVSIRDQNKFLVLNEGRHPSPDLQSIPEANLAGDLAAATNLYGRPVVRGCFVGGSLVKFEERKVIR
ncbi:MAG: hypothetical protein H7318_10985 [Oligoflexus sp.]|nr:hypothetical protein [Oligoflexus sp.]